MTIKLLTKNFVLFLYRNLWNLTNPGIHQCEALWMTSEEQKKKKGFGLPVIKAKQVQHSP